MQRLSAQDDQWLALDSPTNPMQIGALLFYDADASSAGGFYAAVRSHLERRLPATPLLAVHHRAPDDYDAGVWCDVASCDLDYHVVQVQSEKAFTRDHLHRFVAREVLEPLASGRPPFRIFVFDRLVDGATAVMFRSHHSVADGVGFQAIMAALTDPTPEPVYTVAARQGDEQPVSDAQWRAESERRFLDEERGRAAREADRVAAKAELDELRSQPEFRRFRTPEIAGLSGPSSPSRSYDTLSLSLTDFKAIGTALGGTVNDVFLTLVGGALRTFLADTGRLDALDALGDAPLVGLAARSTRRPEHGDYGNHITLVLPQLGTHIADPRERLQAVRTSMRAELKRSELQQRMGDTDDRPWGAKRRREGEVAMAAANVSVSNVPGPAEARYLAGYLQTANYPAPNLPAGHFLNVTLRRYRDSLDLGIMVDPIKVPDVAVLTHLLQSTAEELLQLS